MRQIILFLSIVAILFNACTKGGGNNGGGNNSGGNGGGGNGGGGGNSAGITVTSISPANPYPDDEFTVIGTGFNTDASKDTVEFGRLINGNFGAWHDYDSTGGCNVISATTTELKIKAVNTFSLDLASFPNNTNSIAVVQVRSGGKKAVSSVIPFKRLMLLSSITNPDLFGNAIGRPNDSLVIGGKGFRSTGVSAYIGGTQLSGLKIDSNPNGSKITLRLPKSFFGSENDETIMQDKEVTLVNPDGKIVKKTFKFLISPRMIISSMATEFPTYSKSSGGVVKVYISGRCLKSDATVFVDGLNYHATSNLGVNGFADNTIIELGTGAMPLGNIRVRIERTGLLYGLVDFTLTN